MLFFSIVGISQESKKIEIIKIGQKYNKKEILNAFESASLCNYTFLDKGNLVTLDDGSQINILPANSNLVKEKDCYVSESSNFKNLSWSIQSNSLVIGYPNYSGKSTLKSTVK